MGISMAVCELDCDSSLCKQPKLTILKVRLDSIKGFEEYAEYDEVVSSAEARKVFQGDWEGFLKRNRLDPDSETIFLEKIKKDEDKAKLKPMVAKQYTGWVSLKGVPSAKAEEILKKGDPDNRLTEWDMLSFDQLNETCGKCLLSWDKGRGCIGTFGPETGELPAIAKKYNLRIISQVPEFTKHQTKLSVEDSKELLDEVKVLREKLPLEGKAAVRRYGGVLDRLEAMANICQGYKVRFYFL